MIAMDFGRFKFRMLESCVAEDGADNTGLLVDPRLAGTVNLVVAGLVNMVGIRSHHRMLYHGVLCLANIAQDAVKTVPM